jgi:hypothetical protein
VKARRVVGATVLLGAVVAGLVVDRHRPRVSSAEFGTVALPAMPIASTADALTASWFCPGVPAGPAGSASGWISILNPTDSPTRATLTVVPTEGDPVSREITLAERSRLEVKLGDVAPARFAAALVETISSTVLVEQTSVASLDPAGAGIASATSPCATAPAPSWYLADGSTTTDANETLLVFNPFPDDAVVDFTFFDGTASRKPGSFQGIPVPPHSLRAIPLDDVLQRKEQVAVTATARSGRFVLGRHQTFAAKPRRSLVAGLASPSAGERWWFAAAEQSASASTSLVVYNPGAELTTVTVAAYPADPSASAVAPPSGTSGSGSTQGSSTTTARATGASDAPTTTAPGATSSAEVGAGGDQGGDAALVGVEAGIAPLEVTVGGGQAVVVALSDIIKDATGRYSLLVTAASPVVVERRLAIVADPRRTTPLQFGIPLLATRWWFPAGGSTGGAATLTVVNPGATDVVLTVRSLGPAGLTPVAGSEQITLRGAASIKIDLTAAKVGTLPVVVDASGPVAAEQLLVPGIDAPGASSAPGIPVIG